jgi:hypothetical protein
MKIIIMEIFIYLSLTKAQKKEYGKKNSKSFNFQTFHSPPLILKISKTIAFQLLFKLFPQC